MTYYMSDVFMFFALTVNMILKYSCTIHLLEKSLRHYVATEIEFEISRLYIQYDF